MGTSLNQKQADLLRLVCRERHPISSDELDGRTLRALLSRGFVRVRGQKVSATDEGRQYLDSAAAPRLRRRKRATHPADARSIAILRAVEQLEAAIPPEAEVRVGPIQAAADDVLSGLRKHAVTLAAPPRS